MKERDDTVLKWIDANRVLTSTGEPFEWYKHSFLIEPLIDWHPTQGINKCTQVGFSEGIGILKAFFAAKELKLNVIYTLPSDRFIQNFVPPKVDTIIANNRNLSQNISGGVYLKKVGKGLNSRYIYFLGAFNPESSQYREETSKGVAVSSDLNIHDEASRSDQFVISQMKSRLANSKYRGVWMFDNPTYPNMGADSVYRISDQRHWFVKCSKCNYWQYLDWIRLDKFDFKTGTNHCFIDPISKQFICGKCQKPLSDYDRINGEWVAKYPKITDYRGYWISQLCYVQHTVNSIMKDDDDIKMPKSQFSNMILGKPYIGSDVKVTRQNIIDLIDGNKNEKQNVAMGVDQGKVKWWVLGNEQGIFACGHTEKWEEIERIRKQYDATMVVDNLPYPREPREMSEKYPGKVYKAVYKSNTDVREMATFGTKSDPYLVQIKREEAFDVLVDQIQSKQISIQASYDELELFIEHWESMTRIVSEDSEGNQRFRWIEVGDDHFAHATLYWFIAMLKTRKGSIIPVVRKKQGTDNLKRLSNPADIFKNIN